MGTANVIQNSGVPASGTPAFSWEKGGGYAALGGRVRRLVRIQVLCDNGISAAVTPF